MLIASDYWWHSMQLNVLFGTRASVSEANHAPTFTFFNLNIKLRWTDRFGHAYTLLPSGGFWMKMLFNFWVNKQSLHEYSCLVGCFATWCVNYVVNCLPVERAIASESVSEANHIITFSLFQLNILIELIFH